MVPTPGLRGYEAPAPRFGEFRQAVRRYRPTDLLPFLAREAANLSPTFDQSAWRGTPPWGFASIGRESILHGNEHRSASVDAKGLRRIFSMFNSMHEEDPDGVDIHRLMTGLFYEQFPYALSIKAEITRSYLMMADPRLPGPDLQSEDWPAVLGTSLDEAIRATFLLWVGAGINQGTYNPDWVRQPNFADVNAIIPADVTEATAKRLTGTVKDAKQDARDVEAKVGQLPLHLAQYAYNPLTRRPLVDLGHTVRYAPQYQLIIQSAMPDSLYYAGVRHGGNHFARRLGERVEHYAGWQLQSSGLLDLRPQITYSGSQRSVDWFIILPGAVVLIECKSARLSLDARAGNEEPLQKTLERYVGGARKQINRTVKLVRDKHQAEFAAIPADRDCFGLIVTSEPFYTANVPELTSSLPPAVVPTNVVALRDIEILATLDPREFEQVVRDTVGNPERSTWNFAQALKDAHPDLMRRSNPLIDETYSQRLLPLREAQREAGEQV